MAPVDVDRITLSIDEIKRTRVSSLFAAGKWTILVPANEVINFQSDGQLADGSLEPMANCEFQDLKFRPLRGCVSTDGYCHLVVFGPDDGLIKLAVPIEVRTNH